MARREIRNRTLSRKAAYKKPKLTIYAYCEGKNSEPIYLTEFCQIHGNGLVHIFPEKSTRGCQKQLLIIQ